LHRYVVWREDESVLLAFTAFAAIAIQNANQFSHEQKTRAIAEALVRSAKFFSDCSSVEEASPTANASVALAVITNRN
jgi:GAF domain-containing protein